MQSLCLGKLAHYRGAHVIYEKLAKYCQVSFACSCKNDISLAVKATSFDGMGLLTYQANKGALSQSKRIGPLNSQMDKKTLLSN